MSSLRKMGLVQLFHRLRDHIEGFKRDLAASHQSQNYILNTTLPPENFSWCTFGRLSAKRIGNF